MNNLNARAADLYDNALDAGEPFTLADLSYLLAEELRHSNDLDSVLIAAAERAVGNVDKQRTAPSQAGLFDDALDQAVPIGNARRLSRRHMLLSHWVEHLTHVGENAARVNNSAARENTRFTALAGYLVEGCTTEQAHKQWAEDHPGEVLA